MIETANIDEAPPTDLLDNASLFLDFDGTLVEFERHPGAVRFPRERRDALQRMIERQKGRLAVLSGRGLDDIAGLIDLPGLTICGSHGLEMRFGDGKVEAGAPSPHLEEIHSRVRTFAERHSLIAEEKRLGVALHYRANPERGEEARQFLRDIADNSEFQVQEGNRVCELRMPGDDKGDILKRLMATEQFNQGRPLMIGDDLTDEHGFEAARVLGGTAIIVGERHPTRARYRLASPRSLWEWFALS